VASRKEPVITAQTFLYEWASTALKLETASN